MWKFLVLSIIYNQFATEGWEEVITEMEGRRVNGWEVFMFV